MSRLNEVFSINLERFRKDAGLSQDDVAKKIGMARNTISRYESMEASPSFEAIEKLADLLNLDETTLVTDPEVIQIWQKVTSNVEQEMIDTLDRMDAESKGEEYVPKERPKIDRKTARTMPYWPKLIKGVAPTMAGREVKNAKHAAGSKKHATDLAPAQQELFDLIAKLSPIQAKVFVKAIKRRLANPGPDKDDSDLDVTD